jgi:hypothetical protein
VPQLREVVLNLNPGGQGTSFLQLDGNTVLQDNFAVDPFK